MKRRFPFIALLLLLLSFFGSTAEVYAQNEEELRIHKLKAAFVLNFARFTVWPEDILTQSEEFALCIFGEDPVGDAFAGVESKRISSKPIKVIQTNDISEALQCNLIYVGQSELNRLNNVLDDLADLPILLVSDIEDFVEYGGIIELSTIGSRLGFSINNSKAKEVNLKINSSLLDLASEVF